MSEDKAMFNPRVESIKEPQEPVGPEIVQMDKEDYAPFTAQVGEAGNQEEAIQNAMSAVNNLGEGSSNDLFSEEDEKVAEVTEEEEDLAEQMLFKGYAEKDVVIPLFRKKGTYITVTTVTPQEIGLVNQIMFDLIHKNENKDGNVTIPEIEIGTTKNAYLTAISYLGINGEDMVKDDPTCSLEIIKMAIKKSFELLYLGDSKRGGELLEDIKEKLFKRMQIVRQMPTPISDFINSERYEFESRMYDLMSSEYTLPK